ncbi:MAG: MBL fold metallo-hydrolase [Myxococcota bacterium]|nr:MBL fold metallo-hydrolase [Myxococcota bacterium]
MGESENKEASPRVGEPGGPVPAAVGGSTFPVRARLPRRNTAVLLMVLVVTLTVLAALVGWRISARAEPPRTFRLTGLGHSSFLLETPGGARLLLDPLSPSLGYPVSPVAADLVLVSHGHFDHANVAQATGQPEVLQAVSGEPPRVQSLQRTFRDVTVRSVASWHDALGGKERGPNGIWVIEAAGVRIVHLGDLGHLLTKEQLEAIGAVDVLLIPVGGTFTIDEQQARKVIAQLAPRRYVIPMHFATPRLKMKLPLAPLAPFLRGWKSRVAQIEGPTLVFDSRPSGQGLEIIVLATP